MWYKFTKWTPDADHDGAKPGVDYVVMLSKLKHEDILVVPSRKDASGQYETLRNS